MTSAFDIVESRCYFLFPVGFSVYFATIASKNLQKSSAIQNISVTLSSVIIAIFVCNCLYISSLKLQQISLITKFIDTYNSSNSRYLRVLPNTFSSNSGRCSMIFSSILIEYLPVVYGVSFVSCPSRYS